RLPEITTQLADSAGLTPYRSQNAAVSAATGSISATPTSPAASPSAASALATGAASKPGLLSAGTAASEPMDTSTPLSSYHVRAQHIVAGKPEAWGDRARSAHRDGRGVAAGTRRRRPHRHGTHSFLLQQDRTAQPGA